MKVKAGLLSQLLDRLCEKTGYTRDFSGLKLVAEEIDGIKERYLYRVEQDIKNQPDNKPIGLSSFYVQTLLSFLGYRSLEDFERSVNRRLDEQLLSLEGSYYCYLRENQRQFSVLRSPVLLKEENGEMKFTLIGGMMPFTGHAVIREGALFIAMESKNGKQMHHVYKIGKRKEPKVLQGIFVGVSTAFDPIGGRTVLVKSNDPFNTLSKRKFSYPELSKSKEPEHKNLASYFREYQKNNLAPERSYSFSNEDLAV